jgi:hypothetical protein
MREGRHLGEQLGLDVLSGHEQVGGLEPAGDPRLDEVLPLDREQPELVAPPPLAQLADELQALVVARGDQQSTMGRDATWPSPCERIRSCPA